MQCTGRHRRTYNSCSEKGSQVQRSKAKWFSQAKARDFNDLAQLLYLFLQEKGKSRQTEYHERLKMKDQYWPSPLGDAKTECCSSTWRWFDPFSTGLCQEHRPQRMLLRIKTDVSSPSAIFFCQLQKEIATKDEAKNTDLKKKRKAFGVWTTNRWLWEIQPFPSFFTSFSWPAHHQSLNDWTQLR